MNVCNQYKIIITCGFLVLSVFILSSCGIKGFSEPSRKGVFCYNGSMHNITVTSITGIRTYAKGRGPENLLFGKLKGNGYAAIKSTGALYVKYPIEIKWVNSFVNDIRANYPTSLEQKITKVYGVEEGRTYFFEEMSLILVYNGRKWSGYYTPKTSLLKKDIYEIIESY